MVAEWKRDWLARIPVQARIFTGSGVGVPESIQLWWVPDFSLGKEKVAVHSAGNANYLYANATATVNVV